MEAASLLEGLDESQQRAVTNTDRPLCIEAPAGSGKTRVLTRRIAYRVAVEELDPRRVLVLTFTRKAAGELRERLRQLGLRDQVVAGTFHAVALGQLRGRWEERGVEPPELLDRKVGFVARLLPAKRRVEPLAVVTEIEWAKARLIPPGDYVRAVTDEKRTNGPPPELVAEIYRRYETTKREQRLVDFDDLLRLCARAMQDDREFATVQQWRHRHLFVDEFQDVNPLQFALLRTWLGSSTDLCVVGDPNQAIYGWNGADPRLLTDFDDHFPGAGRDRLEHNYRSTPQIVRSASAVLGLPGDRVPKAHRPDGDPPTIRHYATDEREARGIANAAREQHGPGRSWSAQAVLVRTNAQTALIAQALKDAGIPHRVRGGSGALEQSDVRAAVRHLQRHQGPFEVALADLHTDVDELGDEESDRAAGLRLLLGLAHEYTGIDPRPTGPGFAAWLRASSSDDVSSGGDAVEVATFHAAKGLEWEVVHVAGLEKGLVPIGYAKSSAAMDEERRLLYVALTRAHRQVSCSWAQERRFGERVSSRKPSPWLTAIEQAEVPADQQPSDWRDRLSSEQRRIKAGRAGHPAGAEDDLTPEQQLVFEALRGWRTRAARAADVPAFVVFDDRTLRELVVRNPRTADELLTVPGVGPVKASRHGDDLLRVLAEPQAS